MVAPPAIDEVRIRAARRRAARPASGWIASWIGPSTRACPGGEKKRSEIFQLMSLAPKVAILDEIDCGLDIDAVREVAAAVEAMRSPDLGVLLITHYSRILRYVTPDRVHVMMAGQGGSFRRPRTGRGTGSQGLRHGGRRSRDRDATRRPPTASSTVSRGPMALDPPDPAAGAAASGACCCSTASHQQRRRVVAARSRSGRRGLGGHRRRPAGARRQPRRGRLPLDVVRRRRAGPRQPWDVVLGHSLGGALAVARLGGRSPSSPSA